MRIDICGVRYVLERLKNVEDMANEPAESSLTQICIAHDWIFRTVHGQIQLPDDLASAYSEEIEEGVRENSGSVPHLLEGCTGVGKAKNIGCDEVKDCLPGGNTQRAVQPILFLAGHRHGGTIRNTRLGLFFLRIEGAAGWHIHGFAMGLDRVFFVAPDDFGPPSCKSLERYRPGSIRNRSRIVRLPLTLNCGVVHIHFQRQCVCAI